MNSKSLPLPSAHDLESPIFNAINDIITKWCITDSALTEPPVQGNVGHSKLLFDAVIASVTMPNTFNDLGVKDHAPTAGDVAAVSDGNNIR